MFVLPSLSGGPTQRTEQVFAAKAQCFVDQYNQYTLQGPDGQMHNISGKFTMDENIADNGGLRLAFGTWKARYDADEANARYHFLNFCHVMPVFLSHFAAMVLTISFPTFPFLYFL